MLEVTVKTLDSQNHSFSVPDDSTVKEFKQQITPVLGIAADKQRLIFCGRVLQDDKKLKDYNVDGKVLHLVQRPPPQPRSTRSSSSSPSRTSSSPGSSTRSTERDGNSFVLGAFNIPRDVFDPTHVQNIVEDVVSGMGEWGRNATVMSRTSEDGSSVDVRINLGLTPLQSEAQARINQTQIMLTRANTILQVLDTMARSNETTAAEGEETESRSTNVGEAPCRIDALLRSNPSPPPAAPPPTPPAAQQESSGPSAIVSETVRVVNLADLAENSTASSFVYDSRGVTSEEIPLFTQFCGHSNTGESQRATETTNVSTPPTTQVNTDRAHFGEGIANAARAAVAAAVAAAAGAAAAARVATSTTGGSTNLAGNDQSAQEAANSFIADLLGAEDAEPDIPVSVPPQTGSTATTTTTNTVPQIAFVRPPTERLIPIYEAVHNAVTGSGSTSLPSTPNRRPVQPSVNAIIPLWEEITAVNNRLQPHLQRCMEQIRSDTPLSRSQVHESQNMFDWISKVLHFLSHAYHNLSDLYVNFNQNIPRTLRVRIVASSASPTFMHGTAIPLQTQVNIASAAPTFAEVAASLSAAGGIPTSTSAATTTASSVSQTPPVSTTSESQARPTTTDSSSTRTTSSFPSSVPLGNPFVFMEVGPSAITIDSISATVVDTQRGTVITSAPPSSTTIPVFTTTSSLNSERPQSDTTFERETEGTRLSSSLPSFITGGSAMPPFRSVNPLPFPISSLAGLRSFDPNLPCSSIWALEPSVRRRHYAGTANSTQSTSTSTAASTTASAPTTTTTTTSSSSNVSMPSTTPGRQTEVLHNVISGLVNTVLTEATSGSRPITASASIPGFAVFASSASPDDAQTHPSAGTNTANTGRDSRSSDGTGENNQSGRDPRGANLPRETPWYLDEIFTNLMQGLQLSFADQESRVTVADFLSRIDEDIFQDGQSIFHDLLLCIARQATFQDLTALLVGQTTPLTRMRPNIQQFVRDRVLHNSEPTEENITRGIDEIITEARPLLDFILAEGHIRSNINYTASIENLLRHHIRPLIDGILTPSNEDFGTFLFRTCRSLFAEFIALNVFCFSDGSESIERITQSSIMTLTRGVSPAMRNWAQAGYTQWFLREMRHGSYYQSLPPEMFSRHVVYETVAASPDSPPVSEQPKTDKSSGNAQTETSPMVVENGQGISPSATAASGTPDRKEASIINDIGMVDVKLTNSPSTENATATPNSQNVRTLNTTEDYPDVVIGSESWHNSVPRDWVPIIARDAHRQRRQAPQGPFSDGYLGGMPSKRRKVMSNGTSASNTSIVLADALQQAITSSNAQPCTSIDQIKREITQDSNLQAAYKEQVKRTVQERLHNDLDFSPERFPNADKYFNQGNQ